MQGSCLCGAVAYEITKPTKLFQYCHCSRCQKTTGSAHGANMFAPVEDFHWLRGEDLLTRFKLPEAKRYSTCFCSQCGSPMPWQPEGMPNMVVPAGSLDEDEGVKPQQSIFWDSRASWYCEPDSLPKHGTLPQKS